MSGRFILALSLALNTGLALMLVNLRRSGETLNDSGIQTANAKSGRAAKSPAVIVRRLHFNWAEIESTDFPTYIANLRRIGCPESTIRDIIVAEVNALYERRKALELSPPEQKWWTPEPDLDLTQAISEQLQKLETEKAELLTQLLGPAWQPPAERLPESNWRFDGPVLSKLTPEQKTAVLEIERRSQIASTRREGQPPMTPAEIVAQRETTRVQLAQILSPIELEEYLLRYSHNASNLRQELRGFSPTRDEFRAIFRVRDAFDHQIYALGESQDPATTRRRADLQRMRDQGISSVLGPARFPLYSMTQDPLFRAAQMQARQNGGSAESVLPIYEIARASEQELSRIRADANLTQEERDLAIQQIEIQQAASILEVVNPPEK